MNNEDICHEHPQCREGTVLLVIHSSLIIHFIVYFGYVAQNDITKSKSIGLCVTDLRYLSFSGGENADIGLVGCDAVRLCMFQRFERIFCLHLQH
jgi:hypothetical protein